MQPWLHIMALQRALHNLGLARPLTTYAQIEVFAAQLRSTDFFLDHLRDAEGLVVLKPIVSMHSTMDGCTFGIIVMTIIRPGATTKITTG